MLHTGMNKLTYHTGTTSKTALVNDIDGVGAPLLPCTVKRCLASSPSHLWAMNQVMENKWLINYFVSLSWRG